MVLVYARTPYSSFPLSEKEAIKINCCNHFISKESESSLDIRGPTFTNISVNSNWSFFAFVCAYHSVRFMVYNALFVHMACLETTMTSAIFGLTSRIGSTQIILRPPVCQLHLVSMTTLVYLDFDCSVTILGREKL